MVPRYVLGRKDRLFDIYTLFEMTVSGVLLFFVSLIILYSLVVLAMLLYSELLAGAHMLESTALKDTFGLILSVLILIEFNHSIALGMRRRSGVLQVRVIVVIAIIVIARKLILLDYAAASLQTLLGLGGLALALGALYWLLSSIERHDHVTGLSESHPDS